MAATAGAAPSRLGGARRARRARRLVGRSSRADVLGLAVVALNLVKNVVGTGVALTLPSGVEAIAARSRRELVRTRVAPRSACSSCLGASSGWGFVLIGETCAATEAAAAAPPPRDGAAAPRVTYAQAWTATLGARTARAPAAAVAGALSLLGGRVRERDRRHADRPARRRARRARTRRCRATRSSSARAAVLLPLCLARSLEARRRSRRRCRSASRAPRSPRSCSRRGSPAARYADAGEFFELIPEANRPSFVGGPPTCVAAPRRRRPGRNDGFDAARRRRLARLLRLAALERVPPRTTTRQGLYAEIAAPRGAAAADAELARLAAFRTRAPPAVVLGGPSFPRRLW